MVGYFPAKMLSPREDRPTTSLVALIQKQQRYGRQTDDRRQARA